MRHSTYVRQYIQCRIESVIEICILVMIQLARPGKKLMCPVPPHGLMRAQCKSPRQRDVSFMLSFMPLQLEQKLIRRCIVKRCRKKRCAGIRLQCDVEMADPGAGGAYPCCSFHAKIARAQDSQELVTS
jgi:hypothetical protein